MKCAMRLNAIFNAWFITYVLNLVVRMSGVNAETAMTNIKSFSIDSSKTTSNLASVETSIKASISSLSGFSGFSDLNGLAQSSASFGAPDYAFTSVEAANMANTFDAQHLSLKDCNSEDDTGADSWVQKSRSWFRGNYDYLFKGLQIPFVTSHISPEIENDGVKVNSEPKPGIKSETDDMSSFSVDISQYEDEVVVRFSVDSDSELRALIKACDTLLLDVWEITDEYVDLRIPRRRINDLLRLLPKGMKSVKTVRKHSSSGADFIEVVPDLQRSVFASYPLKTRLKSHHKDFKLAKTVQNLGSFFEDYRELTAIYHWIYRLQNEFSDLVAVETMGWTYENRPLEAIRVSKGNAGPSVGFKPAIVLTAGFSGRDWLSISNALYVLYNLVLDTTEGKTTILDQLDIVFVPVVNPDGYAYSWQSDRLWRKNRQLTGVSLCSGIDIEHSFMKLDNDKPKNHKHKALTPCSENYGGRQPFEALEAVYLRKLLTDIQTKSQIAGYLQFTGNEGSNVGRIIYPCNADGGALIHLFAADLRDLLAGLVSEEDSDRKVEAMEQQILDGDTLLEHMAASGPSILFRPSHGSNILVSRRALRDTNRQSYSVFNGFCDLTLSQQLVSY